MTYYVYIMASKSGVLYTGVTNDLERRVFEHREKVDQGFTAKYNASKLVYFEDTSDIGVAIEREKQIKGWVRRKNVPLIESLNRNWRDLSRDWAPPAPSSRCFGALLPALPLPCSLSKTASGGPQRDGWAASA